MFELSRLFIDLALILLVWDRGFWLLSLCFPSVALFRQLQLPRWKWPGK